MHRIKESKSRLDRLFQEVTILKALRHPHIVDFEDLEFCNLGSLKDYISRLGGRLQESESRYFLRQLVSGVTYLHEHSVIHRDLKSENLLLSGDLNTATADHRPILKISDFGIADWSKTISPLTASATPVDNTPVGTLLYVAPEILKGQAHNTLSDIDLDHLLRMILDEFPDPLPIPSVEISADAVAFLAGTLQRKPSSRIDGIALRKHTYLNLEYVPGPFSESAGMAALKEAQKNFFGSLCKSRGALPFAFGLPWSIRFFKRKRRADKASN
ncbi:kinase-like domain-containing protein [Chytridium lagenaria]|nr:kinase-like domain-containing protein [Chytridium lagenaria]